MMSRKDRIFPTVEDTVIEISYLILPSDPRFRASRRHDGRPDAALPGGCAAHRPERERVRQGGGQGDNPFTVCPQGYLRVPVPAG